MSSEEGRGIVDTDRSNLFSYKRDSEQMMALEIKSGVDNLAGTGFRQYESEATLKGDLLEQSFERKCATANS